MIKVVYNSDYGGFALSKKASIMFNRLKGYQVSDKGYVNPEYGYIDELPRHDEDLVKVVEELGMKASGYYSELKIAKIPGDKYIINEYDGFESVQAPEDIDWIYVK